MGFQRLLIWIQAALSKYVWAISTKQDNLWVKWIHSVYLKEQNWWNYNSNKESSWHWMQIVVVKDKIKMIISENQFISLR